MRNLRQFLSELRKRGEVVDIFHEVDPDLEIAEVHRRVAEENGPALFFHKVKNSTFPVVTNLFGSQKRIEIAFGNEPEAWVSGLSSFIQKDFPPKLSSLFRHRKLFSRFLHLGTKNRSRAPILEHQMSKPDLESLPLLKLWPEDGGSFMTLPLVYTEPPAGGSPNLGMYRIQRFDKQTAGLHFQIGKGGGFHYDEAEKQGQSLPVTIFLGGPPALILGAIAPLPENISELLLTSLLLGKKLETTPNSPHSLISECEFAITGMARPNVRRPEGPFGDHYGYYSLQHDFPVFECQKITHRKDAIYPATVVGKPRIRR